MARRKCLGVNAPLLSCDGNRYDSDFFSSWNPFKDGKLEYCRYCVDKMYDYYLKQTNSPYQATYLCCKRLDIPYIRDIGKDVIEKAIGKRNPEKGINAYIDALLHRPKDLVNWRDFDSTDCTLEECDKSKSINSQKKKEVSKPTSMVITDAELDNYELKWGHQDNVKDYFFLEDTFNRYTRDVLEFVNEQQIDLFRDLCRDRLLLRKITDGVYDGNETIDKIQARVERLMKTLKLDDFDSGEKPKTLSEKFMFARLTTINENNVRDIYKEPKKDFDFNKREKYVKDMCLRPLGNMLLGNKDFDINLDDLDQYNL